MADIVERLELKIRRHVLGAMPQEATFLKGLDLGTLLIEYRVWRGQFIPPGSRRVHESRELKTDEQRKQHQTVLDGLIAKLEAGHDINAYLSSSVQRIKRPRRGQMASRDQLLSEWGIHHLHLSDRVAGDGFVERTDDVLFGVFKSEDAYLLGIYGHPDSENWAAQEIFARLVRNWPDQGLAIELKDVCGLAQQFDDAGRLLLREAGVQGPLEIDGKVYSSAASLGQTTAGTPIEATVGMQRLTWALCDWRENFKERLLEAGADPNAYWIPKVESPMPGFEEHAGFASGGHFVSVARII